MLSQILRHKPCRNGVGAWLEDHACSEDRPTLLSPLSQGAVEVPVFQIPIENTKVGVDDWAEHHVLGHSLDEGISSLGHFRFLTDNGQSSMGNHWIDPREVELIYRSDYQGASQSMSESALEVPRLLRLDSKLASHVCKRKSCKTRAKSCYSLPGGSSSQPGQLITSFERCMSEDHFILHLEIKFNIMR